MTLEWRAANMASRARRVNGGGATEYSDAAGCKLEWRSHWPIGDLHCADIGGKANINAPHSGAPIRGRAGPKSTYSRTPHLTSLPI
jgi:hypothetical protein